MEQVPEGLARGESGDVSAGGRGVSPSEVKRIRHEAAKHKGKKPANQPQK